MGVSLDIGANTKTAEQQLEALNRKLIDMVSLAKKTQGPLGSFNIPGFRNIARESQSVVNAFKTVKTSGVDSMKSVGNEADKTSVILGKFKTLVASVATTYLGIQSIRVWQNTADDLLKIQNRLGLVVSGADELIKKQRELYTVSRETRSSFASTADLYVDFAKALENTGIAQGRITGVVKTIQQAGALSGSSVEALNASVLQLKQGLASGTIRGEELNSVLEQNKYLGTALMSTLNMNAGSLRKFAEAGQFTTEVFLSAVEQIGAKTRYDFNKTSVTVEVAVDRVQSAFKMMLGDLNQFTGSSKKMAKNLLSLSDGIDSFSDSFYVSWLRVSQGLKNLKSDFIRSTAAELAIKKFFQLEINPIVIFDKYQQYKAVKEYIGKVSEFFNREKPKVDTSFLPDVKKTLTNFAFPDFETPKLPFEDMKSSLGVVIPLITELGNTLKITFNNIYRLIPIILLPVELLTTKVERFVRGTLADLSASIFDTLIPFGRTLEGIAQRISFFTVGDDRLGRSWVKLFKSSGIKSFVDNLKELNSIRAGEQVNSIGSAMRYFRGTTISTIRAVGDFGRSIGILDNRILGTFFRSDLFVKYFTNFTNVIKRVYVDIFATTLEPMFLKLRLLIGAASEALWDAITDFFTKKSGVELGVRLFDGITDVVSMSVKKWQSISSVSLFDRIFNKDNLITVIAGIKQVLSGFISFVIGFVSGFSSKLSGIFTSDLLDSAINSIKSKLKDFVKEAKSYVKDLWSSVNRSMTISRIKFVFNFDPSSLDKAINLIYKTFQNVVEYAEKFLERAEKVVNNFGNKVKSIFFSIYDAVVGHSYWPDTIDGVIEYTENLFKTDRTLAKFAKGVLNLFSGIKEAVAGDFNVATSLFSKFISDIGKVNWTQVGKNLGTSLSSSIAAGFLLIFGDFKLRLIAVNYFVNLLDIAVDGAFATFGNSAAQALGAISGEMLSNITKGFLRSLDAILDALPTFVANFLDQLGPIGTFFKGLLFFGPGLFSTLLKAIPLLNNLTFGLVAAAAAYAFLVKGGSKDIGGLLFGKEGKKGKQRTDGITDYMKAMRAPAAGAGLFSVLGDVFVNKKLALASAAIFSTTMFKSIGLLEASLIGVPLLAFAVLGKDGGGRIIRDTMKVGKEAVTSAIIVASQVASAFVSVPKLKKIVAWPAKFLSPSIPKVKSQASLALRRVFDDVRDVVTNLSTNRAAYAAGKISLKDMFNVDFSQFGPGNQVRLKDSVRAFWDSVLLMPMKSGNTLGQSFKIIKDNFDKGTALIVSGLSSLSLLNPLKTNVNGIVNYLKNSFAKIPLSAQTAMLELAAIFKSKLFIAGVLTLFSGFALAASDASSALQVIGENLLTITAVFLGAAVAGKALLYVMGLIKLFKTVKEAAYSDMYVAKNLEFIDFKSTLAGLSAVRAELTAKLQAIAAAISAFAVVAQGAVVKTIFNPKWWESAAVLMTTGMLNVRQILSAPFKLPGLIKDMRAQGMSESLKVMAAGLVSAFASIGPLIASTLKGMMTLGSGAGSVLKGVGTAAMSLASMLALPFKVILGFVSKIFLIGTVVVGALGYLGLMFFGPEGSFLSKLEWVYDKVKSLFGLTPTGATARRDVIKELLPSETVAGVDLRLGRTIDDINFNPKAMSPERFRALEGAVKEARQRLDEIRDEELSTGSVSAAKKTEVINLKDKIQNILVRQPQSEKGTLADYSKRLEEAMMRVDTSTWTTFKNIIGWRPQTEMDNAAQSIVSGFRDMAHIIVKIAADLPGQIGSVFPTTKGVTDFVSSLPFKPFSSVLNPLQAGGNAAARLTKSTVGKEIEDIFKRNTNVASGAQKSEFADAKAVEDAIKPNFKYLDGAIQELYLAADAKLATAADNFNRISQRGLTSKDHGYADYDLKRFTAYLEKEQALEDFLALKRFGKVADDAKELYEYKDGIKGIVSQAKELADIDLGDVTSKFLGGEQSLGKLKDYLDQISLFESTRFNKVGDLSLQDSFQSAKINKSIAEKQAKGLIERANLNVFRASRTESQSSILGIDGIKSEIKDLNNVLDDGTRAAFLRLTESIAETQIEINNFTASRPISELNALNEQLAQQRLKALKMLPISSWVDDVNSGLEAIKLDKISPEKSVLLQKNVYDELATKIKDVRVASVEFQALTARTDAPWASKIEALAKLLGLTKEISSRIEAATTAQVLNIRDNPTLNQVDKLSQISELTGKPLSLGNTLTPERLSRSVKVLSDLAVAQNNLNQTKLAARTQYVDPKDIAEQTQLVNNLTYAAGKLEELPDRVTTNFDDIISKLAETQVSIDALTFSKIPVDIQKQLSSAMHQVNLIDKKLSSEGSGALGGRELSILLDSKEKAILKARDLLLNSKAVSGANISKNLDDLGVDANARGTLSSTDILEKLLQLRKQAEATSFDLSKTTTAEEYIKKASRQLTDKRAADRFTNSLTVMFSGALSNVNEQFKTTFDNLDFSNVADSLQSKLAKVAAFIKDDLENINLTGETLQGESGKSFFAKLDKLAIGGKYLQLFSDLAKGVRESITEGAKTAFNKLSELAGDSKIDFEAFLGIDSAKRRSLSKTASESSTLEKILELPNFTKGMADIFNRLEDPSVSVSSVLADLEKEFKDTFGKDLSSMLDRPLDKNTSAIEVLTSGIDRLIDTINGKAPTSRVGATGDSPIGASDANSIGEVTQKSVKRLLGDNSRRSRDFIDAARASMSVRRQAEGSLGDIGRSPDSSILNRMNSTQLFELNSLASEYKDISLKIKEAANAGTSTINLQERLDELESVFDSLSDIFQSKVLKLIDAGKSFASGIGETFGTALTDFLKGKADENKSAFTTFRDSIVGTFTSTVVDTFTKGLLEPLTGEKGIITTMLRGLGQSIFKMGSEISQSAVSSLGETSMFSPTGMLGKLFGPLMNPKGQLGKSIDLSTSDIAGGITGGMGVVQETTTATLMATASTTFMAAVAQFTAAVTQMSFSSMPGGMSLRNFSGGGFGSGFSFGMENLGQFFAEGGIVRGSPGMAVPVTAHAGELILNEAQQARVAASMNNSSQQVFNVNVTGDISRQTKSEIVKMLPQIASGVNSHNREINHKR